jgi:hypothetical protein
MSPFTLETSVSTSRGGAIRASRRSSRRFVDGGAASTTTSLAAAASARVAPRVIARARSARRTTSGQSTPVTV